jgi:nitrate reductase gamma subunit
MQRWFSTLLGAGAGAYVLSLAAMAGYYVHETFQGRMEWRWILFGPSILTALIVLDYGLYRKLVKNNLPTWRRFNQYISRDQNDPKAMRRTLVDEVIIHRSLFHTSKIRWLRHTLIYWGFMAMFATELIAVIIRDGFPAFGWRDIWREQGNPIRLAFAFIFDITGLMVVLGCLLALMWRVAVNAKPERKYSDTPTTIFLLFVVVTGFMVEGLHLLPTLGVPGHRAAFVGVLAAQIMAVIGLTNTALYEPLWLIHVVAACGFIAYVPVMRLIHSCATPLGRLANSQIQMLAAKKRGVMSAMLLRPNR